MLSTSSDSSVERFSSPPETSTIGARLVASLLRTWRRTSSPSGYARLRSSSTRSGVRPRASRQASDRGVVFQYQHDLAPGRGRGGASVALAVGVGVRHGWEYTGAHPDLWYWALCPTRPLTTGS